MRGYPPRFQRAVWCVTVAAFATGLLLLPTTLDLRLDLSVGWRLPAPARVGAAAAHAFAAFLMLVMSGAIWSIHMRAGWRRSRRRGTGAALVLALGLMALSGLGIYYLGESVLADTAALGHAGVGLAFAAALPVHVFARREMRENLIRKLHHAPPTGPRSMPHAAVPLSELPDGTRATVASVVAGSPEVDAAVLRRLGEIGFIPGEPLQVLRRGPGGREPLAVLIGETMFGLRLIEARCIHVLPTSP